MTMKPDHAVSWDHAASACSMDRCQSTSSAVDHCRAGGATKGDGQEGTFSSSHVEEGWKGKGPLSGFDFPIVM